MHVRCELQRTFLAILGDVGETVRDAHVPAVMALTALVGMGLSTCTE
jgi:hypothetical protein